MGAEGSVAFDRFGEYRCDAFPVNVADTLGAGDAFNSGFLWAIGNGNDLQYAYKVSCAVAAFNLMQKGARNYPDEKKLQRFMAGISP